MAREPYPLGLSLASVVMTALGLSAAALGILWGVPAGSGGGGEVMSNAWLYVQVMFMLMWLVVWPAAALRPARHAPLHTPLWQGAAILIGAIPAAAVAAFLSSITPPMAALMLALQLAAGLYMMGVVALHRRAPAAAAALAGLAAALTLSGPVAAFLWTQFFPQASTAWFQTLPLIAIAHAARGIPSPIASLWTIAAIQALLGLSLLPLARSAQKKAPGSGLPGA